MKVRSVPAKSSTCRYQLRLLPVNGEHKSTNLDVFIEKAIHYLGSYLHSCMHFIIVFGFADNTRSIRLGQLKCERTAAGLANSNRQKQFIMHSNLAKSDHSSYYGISIRITFCYGFHWLQWNVTVLLNKSLKALHTYSASRPTRDDSCHGNRWQVLPVVDSSMWYYVTVPNEIAKLLTRYNDRH